MVSYTRFRTKPLQKKVKKVSYKRFSTKLFQNDVQKVSYKSFRMIPSWKYGNQGFVKSVSEEINPFRVNPPLQKITSKCLNRGGSIRSTRNIESIADYTIIASKSTIKYLTTYYPIKYNISTTYWSHLNSCIVTSTMRVWEFHLPV